MQRVENKCTSSALTKFASWTDRDNTKNYFWHGDRNSTDEGCRCSFEGECASFGLMKTQCNCDGFGKDAIDSGEITSMMKLPITKLNYGTSIPTGHINYYLGPMICGGKRGSFPSEKFEIDKKIVQEQIRNVTNNLQQSKHEVESAISKLHKDVEQKIEIEKKNVEELKTDITNNLQRSKNEVKSAISKLQTDVEQKIEIEKKIAQEQITNITNNLQQSKNEVESAISKLQTDVDLLNTNLNFTVQQLINVTSINKSISRQKRDCDNNVNQLFKFR